MQCHNWTVCSGSSKRNWSLSWGIVQFASEYHLVLTVNNLSEGKEDVQQVRAAVDRIGMQSNKYKRTSILWLTQESRRSKWLQESKLLSSNWWKCHTSGWFKERFTYYWDEVIEHHWGHSSILWPRCTCCYMLCCSCVLYRNIRIAACASP